MASLEIGPLSIFLEDPEIRSIRTALGEQGAPTVVDADDDDSYVIETNLDDDLLADFMDQLEANDAGSDLYLPIEFEDVFEAAGHRVGSAHALLLALANMKDDMGIAEEDEDEADDDDYAVEEDDDEPGAIDLKDQQLRHLWRAFFHGATAAIDRHLTLIVQD